MISDLILHLFHLLFKSKYFMIDVIIESGMRHVCTIILILKRYTLLTGSTLFLSLLFIVSACSPDKQEDTTQESFLVAHPVLMDTVVTKEYVAEIQSIQNVELRARVSGFIEKIHVDEGQSVQAGQTLFSISSQGFKEELLKANAIMKSAVAEARVAEVELKSTRKLVEKNIVSASELEMSEAKLEAIQARIDEARSAVSAAQLQLSFTEVKAPFQGVINRIPNKPGSLIEEGALLTTLSNNREVFAYFNMSEQEYMQFIKGPDASKNKNVGLITADNEPYNLKGMIEIVESEIDKKTGTIAFRARFPNPALLLKHGASGKVVLNTALKNAVLIPQKSTFEIQENLYVYVVGKDNVVQQRSITTGFRLPQLYVVQSGLTPKDNIIFEGIQRVKEGETIKPEQISLDKQFLQLAHK
jgi:RND family efflux transporter MFP subunit